MLYACVNMIFWRVFMRISYTCPPHLTFSLTVEKWTNLVKITGDVIDWLDKHESMYDVWLVTAYSATSCALVQVSSSFCRTSTLISDELPYRHDLLCLYCRMPNRKFNFPISSTILGLEGLTPMLKQSLKNCVTAYGVGRHLSLRITCRHDGRRVHSFRPLREYILRCKSMLTLNRILGTCTPRRQRLSLSYTRQPLPLSPLPHHPP